MTNRFYAGQTNYIEEMNALDGETGDHIADTTGAHAATAISNTPAGNIAATTVQAAINELDTEKLSASATTLPASFTASSLTSVGTLTALTVSGQASFAAGTAAAPGVKVGAEQNGLYSSAANTLDVTLGGVRQAQFAYAASAVNYARILGGATGTAVGYGVDGTDASINWAASSKGSNPIALYTNNFSQLQVLVNHAASAVNYASVTGAATGNAVRYGVGGSDSNIAWAASSKGTFGLGLYTNNFTNLQFAVSHTASAVNYLQATGAATGNAPSFAVGGSDANVYFNYYTKGNGAHQFLTGGGLQLLVGHVASAVNQWAVQGGATGQSPFFFANGTDTNVSAGFSLKGAGNFSFYTGTTTATQLIITHTASSVNYASITGAATGNAVTASAAGSDSNIDFAITPKGTGNVRFGTHSAIAAETVTGYITIKDSAGNSRKLAVVS